MAWRAEPREEGGVRSEDAGERDGAHQPQARLRRVDVIDGAYVREAKDARQIVIQHGERFICLLHPSVRARAASDRQKTERAAEDEDQQRSVAPQASALERAVEDERAGEEIDVNDGRQEEREQHLIARQMSAQPTRDECAREK